MEIKFNMSNEELATLTAGARQRDGENTAMLEAFMNNTEQRNACINMQEVKKARSKAAILKKIIKKKGYAVDCIQVKENVILAKHTA